MTRQIYIPEKQDTEFTSQEAHVSAVEMLPTEQDFVLTSISTNNDETNESTVANWY